MLGPFDFLTIEDTSKEAYRNQLKYFLQWLKDNSLELEQVKETDLAKYGKRYAFKTAKLWVTATRHYVRKLGLTEHPILEYWPKKRKRVTPRAHRHEVMEELINSIDRTKKRGKRDYPMIVLNYETALRAAEMCRLRINDIDWRNCKLKVVVKGGDEEEKQISEECREVLRTWLKDREQFSINGTNTLFCSIGGIKPGNPITPRGLRDIYLKMGNKIDITLSPHDVRRSFAVNSVLNGTPIPAVMTQGGWTDLKVFMAYLETIITEDYRPYFLTIGLLKVEDE
jgi:integrase